MQQRMRPLSRERGQTLSCCHLSHPGMQQYVRPVQVRMEEIWKSMRQQEDKRAAHPGLLSKLRKNMSSSGR